MSDSQLFSLKGRRAMVTGAAQGIGFALARGLGNAGSQLLLNDIDPEKLEVAAAELRKDEIQVVTSAFDVTQEGAIAQGLSALMEKSGPPDILINNAGIHRKAPLLSMPLANWQAVLDLNLTSAFLVSRAVARGMIDRGSGKIVNICSLNSELARPGIGNYAAAKGGLKMLTRAMAVEWGCHNIQVNGLGPGYIATEMTKTVQSDPAFNSLITSHTPAGRWGKTDDLIGAAVFLCSQASDFVNGQILYVDGGFLASI
jgi:gluconate 5-dehydrogenase